MFEVEFPDDLLKDLLDTSFDEIAEEALNEALPILQKSVQSSIRSSLKHGGDDSELVSSIKPTKAKKTKTDAWIANVTPKGYSKTKRYYGANAKGGKSTRSYPVSNALKLIWKEYGVAGRQAPSPCLQRAVNSAQGAVLAKFQEVYERKVKAE